MSLSAQAKAEVISRTAEHFGLPANDTGSPEIQVSVLTTEIKMLTEHCTRHKKDNHSRMGLLKKVSRRRRLLAYIKQISVERYQALISHLNLRK